MFYLTANYYHKMDLLFLYSFVLIYSFYVILAARLSSGRNNCFKSVNLKTYDYTYFGYTNK